MVKTIIFFTIIIALIALIWVVPSLVKWRRRRLQRQSFLLAWKTFLEENLPIYQRLPNSLRQRIRGHIKVFLREKQFIGCGGLQVSDEMKLIIATQACLLLLNERGTYYPKLTSILVYPTAYRANVTKPLGNFVVEESQEVRLGESWLRDQVVFSWQEIQRDMINWRDGHNVVLHEFAHQLDGENGTVDGVPILKQRDDYCQWAKVLGQEYQQLQYDIELGLETVINDYGAINPAEFFAVATETFFEKPNAMKRKHPELYKQLQRYYKLDPSAWM